MKLRFLISMLLAACFIGPGTVQASGEEPAENAEEGEGEEREWLNGFAFGPAYSFLLGTAHPIHTLVS